MIDWAGEVSVRNYGIKREIDSRHLMELLCLLSTLLVLAVVLVFRSWEKSQIINMGYEIQRLRTNEEKLSREEKALTVEEETLKDPQRIDRIARTILGMAPVRAHQILGPSYTDVELGNRNAIAMATTPENLPEPKKPNARN